MKSNLLCLGVSRTLKVPRVFYRQFHQTVCSRFSYLNQSFVCLLPEYLEELLCFKLPMVGWPPGRHRRPLPACTRMVLAQPEGARTLWVYRAEL